MCAADRCHSYGKCWTCPPACGTLEEIAEKAAGYRRGVLLQSTGQMEDDFDVDCMMETERLQKERFQALVERVREVEPDCLPMASGACQICAACTCPDAPCRFPDRAIPSMEAYGLVVSEICQQSNLPYYYGPKTITYTSCVLLR
jgi:predicted metal-binding protein